MRMSSELNRTETSRQYFALRNELNRANRVKNLQTELKFEIRGNDEECFIIVKSTGAENGLRVASRDSNNTFWVISENEIYENFYKYMFLRIRTLKPDDDLNINSILANWLIGLWVI